MERDDEETIIRPRRHPLGEAAVGGASGAVTDADVVDGDTRLVPRATPSEAGPSSSAALTPALASAVIEETIRRPQGTASAAPESAVAWFHFTVNAIEPVALDRPARIGRNPSPPRVPQSVRPRLVRVPSPSQEVSSTHLELRQEGATVLVTDLRSTNGAVVSIPGASARRMRPGESVAVTAGTVVDLGDGNLVEILPRRPVGGGVR